MSIIKVKPCPGPTNKPPDNCNIWLSPRTLLGWQENDANQFCWDDTVGKIINHHSIHFRLITKMFVVYAPSNITVVCYVFLC